MKRIKKRMLILAAAALSIAMVFLALPQDRMEAYADVNDSGSPVIARYSVLQNNPNTADMQVVHYAGRKWIVIAYEGKGDEFIEDDACATLLLKDIDLYSKFNDTEQMDDPYANAYNNSELEARVYDIVGEFSEAELYGAFPRKLEGGGENGDLKKMKGRGIDNAVIWPLSSWEAVGLCEEAVRVYDKDGECIHWWLRTPASYNTGAACIYTEHLSGSRNVSNESGVRPAFFLDPINTLFLSAAKGGKTSGDSGENALQKIGTNPTNEWKTTLLEKEHQGFDAAASSTAVDGILQISYSGAVPGKNEYISALIKDSSDNFTYYGRLVRASATSGDLTVDLSGKFNEGDTLYVFNEQINEDYKTDYASKLIQINFDQLNELDQVELTVTQPDSGTPVSTPSKPFPLGPGTMWLWDQQTNKPLVTLADESKYTFSEATNHCVWISIDPATEEVEGLNTTMSADQSYLADIYLDSGASWYFGDHTKVIVNNATLDVNELVKEGHLRVSVTPIVRMDSIMIAEGKTVKIKSKSGKLEKTKKITAKKAYSIKNQAGQVTFKKVKANKSSKKFTVNEKTGKITVRKGLKRGIYRLRVNISDSGSKDYKPFDKNVTVRIKVTK